MKNLEQLIELANDLNESASNEGCDDDLMVVGAKQLGDLLQFVRQMQKSNETTEAAPPTNPNAEKANKLIDQIAGMRIWDYDKNDGTPYKECNEPGDGYLKTVS